MRDKIRNTTLVYGIFAVIIAILGADATPDGSSSADRVLAASAAMAPWLVGFVILWCTGEIVKQLKAKP
jgi:hypothetical protein